MTDVTTADLTTAALAAMVGGRLVGDGTRRIVGLCDLRTASPDRVGFVRHARYAEAARVTKAGALLLAAELDTAAIQIVVPDVDVAYAKVANHFHPGPAAQVQSIHASAVVHPQAEFEAPVTIGANAVVGRCRIGAGSVVMAGASIGDGATLGRGCVLYPHVVVYAGVTIGDRFIAHANVVVGSDGFGYAREGNTWLKVPQLGSVVIEDDVELGTGTAIDRGTLGNTRIGARTKLDNLCHIAHNCNIGQDVVIAAGGMVAGSTTIGDRCVFAGQIGVAGHITIAADVRLGGATVVLKDVTKSGDYMGHPFMEKRRFMRVMRALGDLDEMRAEFVRGRKKE